MAWATLARIVPRNWASVGRLLRNEELRDFLLGNMKLSATIFVPEKMTCCVYCRAASAPDRKDRHVQDKEALLGCVRRSAGSCDKITTSQWPSVKASMVMGVGSQIHAVEAAPTIWKHVVETQAGPLGGGAGGGGLMAECFKTMQKYQTRCQRLELQLANMQRLMRDAQKERSAHSNGTVSPVDTEASSPTMTNPAKPREAKSKPRSTIDAAAAIEDANLAGANKRVMELEEALEKEKERRFKSSARLKSAQIGIKAMQVPTHALEASLTS
jgi:hypothetical protein